MCEVVKNQAYGKEFWYCREHKVECAPGGCLEEASMPDEARTDTFFCPGSLIDWGYLHPPTDEDDFHV
jgi:hypothetical protein